MRIRLAAGLSLLAMLLISVSCSALPASTSAVDNQFDAITRPYAFNFASWEFNTVLGDIKQKINNPQPEAASGSQTVLEYFSEMAREEALLPAPAEQPGELKQIEDRIKALQPQVEEIIAEQISQVLESQGIYNPLSDGLKLAFPPVNFKLEKPLYVLIVSHRDKIDRVKDFTIKQDISPDQIQEIESSVDSLGLSSLVVGIGGLGVTYPTFVINNDDLKWTINIAAHEWAHQYLAFKPLGFRYVLDLLNVSSNPPIVTINETVANILGNELGKMVYDKYYAQYQPAEQEAPAAAPRPAFDFNKAMRETRLKVDALLAQGQIEQVEQYMESQRQFLATKGYHIRKLNQAYFSFYGSYADNPTSVDPTGQQLKQLRANSSSLKVFLDTVSGFTSSQDLMNAVMAPPDS